MEGEESEPCSHGVNIATYRCASSMCAVLLQAWGGARQELNTVHVSINWNLLMTLFQLDNSRGGGCH